MRLSTFIAENLEAILSDWEAFARMIPSAEGLDAKALRNDAAQLLQAVALDIATARSEGEELAKSRGSDARHPDAIEAAQKVARTHAAQRGDLSFTVMQMSAEYRALRASVVRRWMASDPVADVSALKEVARFHEALDQAWMASLDYFTTTAEAATDLFIAELAHDFRSPLQTITLSGHVLGQPEQPAHVRVKAQAHFRQSTKDLGQMLDDIIDYAQSRAGQAMPLRRERFDLAELCRDALDTQQTLQPRAAFHLQTAGDTAGEWDPVRLRRLVVNLLVNAVKHGEKGGPVGISLDGTDREVVILAVHNHGQPIDPQLIEALFEPWVRSASRPLRHAEANTGLGLHIVSQVVAAHGGTVQVFSAERNATRFEVSLPRLQAC